MERSILDWSQNPFSDLRIQSWIFLRLVFASVGVIRELDVVKIGVGRIRTFPFLLIPFTTPSLMIQWKLGCRSRKQKRKNQPIAKPRIEDCHWFYSSPSACDVNNAVFTWSFFFIFYFLQLNFIYNSNTYTTYSTNITLTFTLTILTY